MRLHTRSGGGSPGADAVSLQPRQHRGAQGSAAPIPIFTHLAAVPPVLHERLDRIDPAGSICTVSSTSQPGPTHYPHSRCHAKGPPPARPLPTRPSVPERRAVAFEPSITAQTPTCVLYTPPRRHVRAIGRPVVSIGRASGVHARRLPRSVEERWRPSWVRRPRAKGAWLAMRKRPRMFSHGTWS